jgi:sulfite exporter TauE/SafE
VKRRAALAGGWLAFYAAGGTLVGVLGFGLLWRGLAAWNWAAALLGAAMLLLGLDRASQALQASVLARHAAGSRRRDAGGDPPEAAPGGHSR